MEPVLALVATNPYAAAHQRPSDNTNVAAWLWIALCQMRGPVADAALSFDSVAMLRRVLVCLLQHHTNH